MSVWLALYFAYGWIVLFVGSFIYLTFCSDGTEPFESALDAVEDWPARLKRKIVNKVIAPTIASALVAAVLILLWPLAIMRMYFEARPR